MIFHCLPLYFLAVVCTCVLVLGQDEIIDINELATALNKKAIPVRQPPSIFKSNKYTSLPPNDSPKIIGGFEATPHAYPYQVALYIYVLITQYFCGGTLISPEWVLTAAHCIEWASWILVVLGTHDLNQEENSTRLVYNATSYVVHEDWNSQTLQYDIALIKLPALVTLNSYINTVSIPHDTDTYTGLIGRCLGWGRIITGAYSNVLRYVDLEVITNQQCSSYEDYEPYIKDQHLCTSGDGIVGTCNYDSGGPLVINGTQVGIVSFGVVDCSAGLPSVFTRLTHFSNWITETMESFDKPDNGNGNVQNMGSLLNMYLGAVLSIVINNNLLLFIGL